MRVLTHPIVAATLACACTAGAFGTGTLFASLGVADAPTSLFPKEVALDGALLNATAAVVWDPASGRILFEKNARIPHSLASLTKLMTAQAVLAERSPEVRVRIKTDDLAPAGDSGLSEGDEFSLGELLRLGLVASSNDAMAAVGSTLGEPVAEMNQMAEGLGLSAHFTNPTGLDRGEDPGGVGSALDVAKLASVFYREYPNFFELTAGSGVSLQGSGGEITAVSTAEPLSSVPGLLAAKTGYTARAGGNLVALFSIDIGRPLVAVVLGSTEKGRFEDMRTLIGATRLAQQNGIGSAVQLEL